MFVLFYFVISSNGSTAYTTLGFDHTYFCSIDAHSCLDRKFSTRKRWQGTITPAPFTPFPLPPYPPFPPPLPPSLLPPPLLPSSPSTPSLLPPPPLHPPPPLMASQWQCCLTCWPVVNTSFRLSPACMWVLSTALVCPLTSRVLSLLTRVFLTVWLYSYIIMYIEHDNIVDLLHQPILPEISASMLCISLLWCNKVSLSTFIVYGASVTCYSIWS